MANGIAASIYERVLGHLLQRIAVAKAETHPFTHVYFENLFPTDLYARMLDALPEPSLYSAAAERHYGDAVGSSVRWMYGLSRDGLSKLPSAIGDLWRGIAAALADQEVKRAVFAKLAPDLVYRYGVPAAAVPNLAGYSRPTLYREVDGFEIPPHPDTRKKIVTMHLYFPGDFSQVDLGTALYRRRSLALPLGSWQRRFEKVKQFEFRPNSGYAFVVNNTLAKRSWHGRERLPEGAGVRNTLLNTFYAEERDGFSGYLADDVPLRPAA
ncbi:MAG TPA: hypothetical protein VN641_06565 [Urbifossiella sp.]|nr:hypothetical protein [Urbifossiella sp.]